MKDLLFHVSPLKIKKKLKRKNNYIAFTKNKFVSYFGNYIYIFDFNKLNKDFNLIKYDNKDEGHIKVTVNFLKKWRRFQSQNLRYEWRVYGKDIDLDKYCIGVTCHFNESKNLQEIVMDKIEKEFMIKQNI